MDLIIVGTGLALEHFPARLNQKESNYDSPDARLIGFGASMQIQIIGRSGFLTIHTATTQSINNKN